MSDGNSTELPPLPAYLDLPPHLSAHKYFMVCTLTVAAWDTLVLSPRNWSLLRDKKGWPLLKILFHFLRVFMPVEFIIVAVAFFDTKWSQDSCSHFYLFEPICTAILLAAASAVHAIRISAIYERNIKVTVTMGALFAAQVVVTGICCGFYRAVPLLEGQGCIAGPKQNWVGVYWVAPTLLYTVSLSLAVYRSFDSQRSSPKTLSLWKLMLRDGLNLYAAIWLVNMANMLFWFIMTPTGIEDPIKTIVTSMAAVLTTTMTLRIILSVRGSLVSGGSFAHSGQTSNITSSRTTHVLSRSGPGGAIPADNTFNLSDIRSKTGAQGEEWDDTRGSDKLAEVESDPGVKVTVDRSVGYDSYSRQH